MVVMIIILSESFKSILDFGLLFTVVFSVFMSSTACFLRSHFFLFLCHPLPFIFFLVFLILLKNHLKSFGVLYWRYSAAIIWILGSLVGVVRLIYMFYAARTNIGDQSPVILPCISLQYLCALFTIVCSFGDDCSFHNIIMLWFINTKNCPMVCKPV